MVAKAVVEVLPSRAVHAPLVTSRLQLRPLTLDDAPFLLRQYNEPAFLRFIGDRGLHTLDDARRAITNGHQASYATNGFGMLLVELANTHTAIGVCGLVKRPALHDVDLGYALLPEYWGQGYAFEAAREVLWLAKHELGLPRVVAIVSPDNHASQRVLEKLGLSFVKLIRLNGEDQPATALFAESGLISTT